MIRNLSTVTRKRPSVTRNLASVKREFPSVIRNLVSVRRNLPSVKRNLATVRRKLTTVTRNLATVTRKLASVTHLLKTDKKISKQTQLNPTTLPRFRITKYRFPTKLPRVLPLLFYNFFKVKIRRKVRFRSQSNFV